MIHPHSSSAVTDVRTSSWSPPTSVESHQSDTTGAEETGEGAMRRRMTHSICLLMDHASTIFQCRVPRPRVIDKYLKLRILEILWALVRLPSYVPLYITWNPSRSGPAHPRSTPLAYGIDQPSMSAMTPGSIGTSSINIRPVGEHSEERTSEITIVQNFL